MLLSISKFFLAVSIVMLLETCKGVESANGKIDNTTQNTEKKNSKFPTYMLNFNIPYPAEVRVNDIVTEINLSDAPYSPCNLNINLLKSRPIQTVSVKVYAPNFEKGGVIKPEDVSKLNAELGIYKYFVSNGEISNMTLLKKIAFPSISNPVPYIESKWEFEVDSLTYDLGGWGKFKNLKTLDEEYLKTLAIEKYKQLAKLLYDGKVNDFVKELEICNSDFFIANDYTKEQRSGFLLNQFEAYDKMKQFLLPIDSFQMKIMGEGRVIALERVNSKYHGQGVIIAEDPDNNLVYFNYMMLAMPLNSNQFKVVRINSFVQGADE